MFVADSPEVEVVEEVGEDHQDSVADGANPEDDELRVMLSCFANPSMRQWLFMMIVDGDIVATDDGEDSKDAGEERQEGG